MTRIHLVGADDPLRAQAERLLRELGHEPMVSAECPPPDGLEAPLIAHAETLTPSGGIITGVARDLPLVVYADSPAVAEVVTAIRGGVRDYLDAPITSSRLATALNRLLAGTGYANSGEHAYPMIGSSHRMTALRKHLQKLAAVDCAVLIQGEIGTGKELAARAIHGASPRRDAPLITLSCATVPAPLIEQELFGNGAEGSIPQFMPGTASGDQPAGARGLLQAAVGGTLYLDDVSELPPSAQAKLLQLLRSDDPAATDVRLIAGTHRDLKAMIASGQFREDLYYRLAVITLETPPLRERGDDVLELADAFLDRTCERLGRARKHLSDDARTALTRYSWPGNVRELANAVERAVLLSEGDVIDTRLLAIDTATPPAMPADTSAGGEQTSLEDYFVGFVTAHQDHMTETELAEKLGISRKSLWERRQRLNIPRKRTRKRGPRRENTT